MIFSLNQTKNIPVTTLCDIMGINRSGYNDWLKRITSNTITSQSVRRNEAINEVLEIYRKHPSHGYVWINSVITRKNNHIQKYSDEFIRRICVYLGIKSKSKHVSHKWRKDYTPTKYYPNLILNKLAPNEPYKVIVSDMTAFRHRGKYHELTMYMDLFNNQILTYAVSDKRGDPNTYYNGLSDLIRIKDVIGDSEMILHTDQGAVYKSANYNTMLSACNILHSMSEPGTPTQNGAMEAINGWMKEELYTDFDIDSYEDVNEGIKNFIHYFNYERPACALGYLTPIEYREKFENICPDSID